MNARTPLFPTLLFAAAIATAAGCTKESVVEGRYEPFDEAVAAESAPYAAAFADINAIRGDAAFGAASFAEIEAVWDAELAGAVGSAVAGHPFASDPTGLGAALSADIEAAIAAGAAGTNVGLQGQVIDKTLQRFFVERMAAGLYEGTREGWDRAFSWYGRSADGTTSAMVSATAGKRDENFGTNYNDDIWNLLIDGRNAFVTGDDAGVTAARDAIDLAVMEVYALSSQREVGELEEPGVVAALDEHEEKLFEGLIFWETIRDHAVTIDGTAAADVDTAFADALADPRDPALVDGFALANMILAIYGLAI